MLHTQGFLVFFLAAWYSVEWANPPRLDTEMFPKVSARREGRHASACLVGKWTCLWDKVREAGLLDSEPVTCHSVPLRRSPGSRLLKSFPFLLSSSPCPSLGSLCLGTSLPVPPACGLFPVLARWCGGQERGCGKPTGCWFEPWLCHFLAEWLQPRGLLTLGLGFPLY